MFVRARPHHIYIFKWRLQFLQSFHQHHHIIPGFIDFIVQPTLTILGDALDAILKPLDYGRRPLPATAENSAETTSNEQKLYRPWIDVLAANKEKWTEKHEAGKIILCKSIFLACKTNSYIFIF